MGTGTAKEKSNMNAQDAKRPQLESKKVADMIRWMSMHLQVKCDMNRQINLKLYMR